MSHVFPVTYKPTVLSPLNVTPEANGSPWLIHDLSRLNKGVVRGPHCSQPDLFQSSMSWNSNTYFCKLDLTHGYYHLRLRPLDRHYFGFSFDRKYYVSNALVFGLSPAPDYFQHFMSDVGQILSEGTFIF